jgi:hypothetical protein
MRPTTLSLRSISRALLVLLAALVSAHTASADGGRLRFRQHAGPFIITLFTTPDPLTRGPADFSVAVEHAGTPGLIQDANVDLILTPADGHGSPMRLHASHAQATTKWLQAANFSIPARGLWRVTVIVRSGNESGKCSAQIRVGPAGTRNLTWDILPVPLAALVFVLHRNRKRKYRRDRRSRLSASASEARSPRSV